MSVENDLKALIIQRFSSVRAFTIFIDMPYSTIDTIFKRGVINSGIDNIMKICNALSISVDALAEGRIVSRIPEHMSGVEAQLLTDFRSLNYAGQRAVLDFIRLVSGNPAMTSPPSAEKKAT